MESNAVAPLNSRRMAKVWAPIRVPCKHNHCALKVTFCIRMRPEGFDAVALGRRTQFDRKWSPLYGIMRWVPAPCTFVVRCADSVGIPKRCSWAAPWDTWAVFCPPYPGKFHLKLLLVNGNQCLLQWLILVFFSHNAWKLLSDIFTVVCVSMSSKSAQEQTLVLQ